MTSQSPDTHLRTCMTRATELEAELAALPPKSSEHRSATIRIQLCEVLSDVLLKDPYYALKKDCPGRLWRNCFYSRIAELRSHVAREKRRKGPNVAQIEKRLNGFLQESIQLYDYLIDRYESKLLSSSQSQDSATATDGVVPGLHRMFIHLGDLHRYATTYLKAETYYIKASKLAPGKGNPYNQLAVLAQLKDPSAPLSCVSLYYYARSLQAAHDPFETSNANLSRLLDGNREWLKSSPITEKANKSIRSRHFLAQFVDLHCDFFKGVRSTNLDPRDWVDEHQVMDKIELVISKFVGLLSDSSFGDSLLCKMVTINAFSVVWAKDVGKLLARAFTLRFGASLAERIEQSLRKLMEMNSIPSVRLLLPLSLACDFVGTWEPTQMEHVEEKAQIFYGDSNRLFWTKISDVANLLSSLRALIQVDDGMKLKEYINLRGFTPFQAFTEKNPSQDVYVSVDEAVRALELNASSTQESAVSEKSGQEENPLKLAQFFAFIDRTVKEGGNTLTCDGSGRYSHVSPVDEEDPIMDDDDEMEDDPIAEFEENSPRIDVPIGVNMDSDILTEHVDIPEDVTGADELDDVTGADEMDDVLVYKPSGNGAGPVLLVPGALLLNKAKANPILKESRMEDAPMFMIHGTAGTNALLGGTNIKNPVTYPKIATPSAIDCTDVLEETTQNDNAPNFPSKQLGPPPGILPPPGFGVGRSPNAPTFPPMSYPESSSDGFNGYADSMLPLGNPKVGAGLHMFHGTDLSQLKTNNPFAAASLTGTTNYNMPPPGLFDSYGGHFLDHEMSVDETSLLDSSLLNSLWMEESGSKPLSKNPFLT